MIKYPVNIFCFKCNGGILLNYNDDTASTNDILSLEVEIPHSLNSGKDARKNKQDIGTKSQLFLICQHCKTILGVVPGSSYLWSYAK
jgi:hypothetical protein